MVNLESIPSPTQDDLEILAKTALLKDFYLAGGTGLATYLNHRDSIDLDFFSLHEFNENQLVAELAQAGTFALSVKEQGTVSGSFRETLVSFFHYPYPLLEKPVETRNVSIASIRDIACMKLDAASSRGTKKDFIDLYCIVHMTNHALPELLVSFSQKFAIIKYNLMHIKKSLLYFADAEQDPMPLMRMPLAWETVRTFFEKEVPKL